MRFSTLPVSDVPTANGSLLDFARHIVTLPKEITGNGTVQQGGELTINGADLGQFDYIVKNSSQTISSSPVTVKGSNIRSLGTNIGDMTLQQGLAAAFDGITSQSTTEGASTGSVTACYIGKTYTTRIYSATVSGSNNDGYINNANPTVTLKLYGKQGSAPSSSTNGTVLGSVSFTDITNESVGREILSSDTATVWDHVWVEISQSGSAAAIRCAEAQLFQAVTQAGFSAVDWFTSRDDKASLIAIKGDLTVSSGITFTPANRKLFTCVYVTGNCDISGEISMTARGGTHDTTGQYAAITASEIRIANGAYSGVIDPSVPAVGGPGGAQRVISVNGANVGLQPATQTSGATGGGGSGGATRMTAGTMTSGNGGSGSCFSGGGGGGGCAGNSATQNALDGSSLGGAGGGCSASGAANNQEGGGAGNPGAVGKGAVAGLTGANGTGGVLMLIVEGTLSGTGNVTANGTIGGNCTTGQFDRSAGGSSGGGSITIMAGTDSSAFTSFAAAGGAASLASGGTNNANGGAGGDGTARKISIAGLDIGFANGTIQDLLINLTGAGETPLTAAVGQVVINEQIIGPADYVIKASSQTVATFTSSDWFSADNDKGAIIIVDGDFTLNAGQIFTPTARKLWTAMYVTGNCAINGEISMTGRGGNHSVTGAQGAIAATEIRIANGTFSSVTNPNVPAAGGTGGAAVSGTTDINGNVGAAGSAGGSGGGGSGGVHGGPSATSGNGAPGTCFSGGPGGGACVTSAGTAVAANGASDGSAGGIAGRNGGQAAGGGVGNPSAEGANGGGGASNIATAANGTGGVVMLFVDGTLTGTGNVTANGVNATQTFTGDVVGAGGSGGGSVTIMSVADSSTVSVAAAGGLKGLGNTTSAFANGGAGGAGSARKLAIYAPQGINFDGTNDWLTRGTAGIGGATKKATCSVWVRRASDGVLGYLLAGAVSAGGSSNEGSFRIDTTNRFVYNFHNENGNDTVNFSTATNSLMAADGWVHVLFSFDFTNADEVNDLHVYFNDVRQTLSVPTFNLNDTVQATADDTGIGALANGGTKFNGDLADFWFSYDTYLDLSVTANRRKFISALGRPVDLGTDGSVPTGTAPKLYLSGAVGSWHTNKGTGGGLTLHGTLSAASSNPY